MSVTPERLAAYADGEVDAAQAREIEIEIAASAELQAELAAHRALRARLAAHFAPIAEQPVPSRLREAVRGASRPDQIVGFADAARDRRRTAALPRWAWIAGPALAATLVMAIFSFGSQSGSDYAQGRLATALDSQLVASQRSDVPLRILLSFRDGSGQFCRGFSEASRAGIACRDERGWRLRKMVSGDRTQRTGEYRQAGSGEADVLAAIQEMATGPALDAEAEAAAMRRQWR